MTPGDTFVRFLSGDVAPICLAAVPVQWVAGKAWFCYVDKVCGGMDFRHPHDPNLRGLGNR